MAAAPAQPDPSAHPSGGDPREAASEELLAAVLGLESVTDHREAVHDGCRRALGVLGGLPRAARMSPGELARELRGPVSPATLGWPRDAARRLVAALELGRRGVEAPLATGRAVHGASDLEEHLRGRFAGRRKEQFAVVLLDARNRPLRTETVSEGCLTWSVVHPREVFAPAVREGAGSIVVAHNHPSGDPEPSRQDLDVTERLRRVGELLGIPLLDHIIVGGHTCLSLRARGHLEGDALA